MDNLKAAGILAAVEAYEAAYLEKTRLKELATENNKEVERLRDELSAMMIEQDLPKLTHGGYSYSVTPKARYSKAAGADDALYRQLRADGLGDLIKETVNANSLSAALKSMAEDNDDQLPAEYDELVNIYEYNDITRRKSAK